MTSSLLDDFIVELSRDKRAKVCKVVKDNARCHRDEKLEDSFSRLPPTPTSSFQKNKFDSRWCDSREYNEHQELSPRPSPSPSGTKLVTPVRRQSLNLFLLSPPSFNDDSLEGDFEEATPRVRHAKAPSA